MNVWENFSLDQVLMTDDYMINSLKLEVEYLLEFEVDKLLAGFRETAGLDQKGQARYGGWENSLIGGHSLGHYLTACAQAYANVGVSKEDKEALYKQIAAIADGLLECQLNTKGEEGFIFGAKIVDQENVERQFDNVERKETDIITQAWVPWYTMHKIISGLVDAFNMTGYEPAKTVASGLGDWTYHRASGWSSAIHEVVLSIEYGGMNDCLYELYKITCKREHGLAAHYFDEERLYTNVYEGTANALNNHHANTTIPKFMGALNRYITLHGQTFDGEIVDASKYLKYVESFWDTVVNKHTYITGGNSEWEHFGYDNILDAERTNCNNETCNIYNMLILSRELFKITGERKYADYYENAYINSILSSQNPETGMTTYFQPMDTGYFKVYGSKFSHFWCCTGSGMENFTKLNDSVYFHKENRLAINMYLSSTLTWKEQKVVVTQESGISSSDTSTFTIQTENGKSTKLKLHLRVPDWAVEMPLIKVNGKSYKAAVEQGYAVVNRSFHNGDVVSITIPMKVTAYGLPDQGSVYAFKYGPVVLSAELGTKSLSTGTTGMNVTIPAEKLVDSDTIVLKEELESVAEYIAEIDKHLIKAEDKLEFKLTGTNMELTFTPHYLQHKQRYGIYWYIDSYVDNLTKAKTGSLYAYDYLDTVQPGYGQYENDELHNMEQSFSYAAVGDIYRYAGKNGWFTYQMIIDPLKENYLIWSLRKKDNGKTLSISIGETEIYAKTLNYEGVGESYSVELLLPSGVIDQNRRIVNANDKDNCVVPITFRGIDGTESAKICEMIYTANLIPRGKTEEISDDTEYGSNGSNDLETEAEESDSNPVLWLGIAGTVVVLIIGLLVGLRKKRKR